MESKAYILKEIADTLLEGKKNEAGILITEKYPFIKNKIYRRNYSLYQKKKIFMRDGFIDRYSGEKLILPGFMKILSNYFPDTFPYHPHGKMDEGHIAYWELFPTIDHIVPIAAGGTDTEENWVTTSMLNNAIKSNWTLEQLKWKLYEPGNIDEWDGLSRCFLKIIDMDQELLKDVYINNWYKVLISL